MWYNLTTKAQAVCASLRLSGQTTTMHLVHVATMHLVRSYQFTTLGEQGSPDDGAMIHLVLMDELET